MHTLPVAVRLRQGVGRTVAHQRLAQTPQLVVVRSGRVRREGRDADALRAEVRYAGLRIGILQAVVRSQACPSLATQVRWLTRFCNFFRCSLSALPPDFAADLPTF